MKLDDATKLGLVLTILAIVPIWLVPIAPLTDWPIHLAVSRELFLLQSGMAQSQYYQIDYVAGGYAFTHALLTALQYMVDWKIAGQMVLTLLVIITPICWRQFFRALAPDREYLFLAGFLLLFSGFYYGGTINFIFGIDFALVWLAVGMGSEIRNLTRATIFLALGVLTYLAHPYVFLLGLGILGVDHIVARKNDQGWLKTYLALLALAGIGLFGSSPFSANTDYYRQVLACASYQNIMTVPELIQGSLAIGWITGAASSFLSFLPPIPLLLSFFPPLLAIMMLMACVGWTAILIRNFQMPKPTEVADAWGEFWKEWGVRFSIVALLLYLHLLLVPYCIGGLCTMNIKSFPLFCAFFLLAIPKRFLAERQRQIMFGLAALVLINIIYQGFIFLEHAPTQQKIDNTMKEMAMRLPDNSTLFVKPAEWNTLINVTWPIYRNPHYHALLLAYNPRIYVSGLFLQPGTYPLKTSFPIYDDMVNQGPIPGQFKGNVSRCYDYPPKEYDHYVDENMTLVKNPNAVQRGT